MVRSAPGAAFVLIAYDFQRMWYDNKKVPTVSSHDRNIYSKCDTTTTNNDNNNNNNNSIPLKAEKCRNVVATIHVYIGWNITLSPHSTAPFL
jgi:hypothetical protein